MKPSSRLDSSTTDLQSSAGTSLLEILIAVAVISILSILAFPVYFGFRTKSDLIHCTSNMRTLGFAIHMYAGEHNSQLPFSSVAYLPARYSQATLNSQNQLVGFLAPYLQEDFEEPVTGVRYVPEFICPAAFRLMPETLINLGRNSYSQHPTLFNDGTPNSPFPFGITNTPPALPSLPLYLSNFDQPSRIITLTDRPSQSATYQIKPGAAHGNVRNVLFFDGRVESITQERFFGGNTHIAGN